MHLEWVGIKKKQMLLGATNAGPFEVWPRRSWVQILPLGENIVNSTWLLYSNLHALRMHKWPPWKFCFQKKSEHVGSICTLSKSSVFMSFKRCTQLKDRRKMQVLVETYELSTDYVLHCSLRTCTCTILTTRVLVVPTWCTVTYELVPVCVVTS